MVSAVGDRSGWWVIGGLLVAVAAWPTACVESSPDPLADDIAAVLANVGPSVVLPALDTYDTTLVALRTEVERWQETGAVSGAQAAFAQTMDRWQVVDVLRVAPSPTIDALGLRDETYSWPVVNPCRVDQVTATGEYATTTLLVNARGLDALQTLLYATAENHCPGNVPPNSDGAWESLGEPELAARRLAYAMVLLDDLEAQSAAYRAAWESPALTDLQHVLDALFVIESVVKDDKLGHPLGLIDCDTFDCSADVEGLPTSNSTAWIAANLEGFRDLFTGETGQGVDDLLSAVGAADVADDLTINTTEAIAMAEALDDDLGAAIRDDRDSVLALYDAVDDIVDLLVIDVTTLLSLQVPEESAGDND